MFFKFIKYAQPGWQFNIIPDTDFFPSCFIKEDELTDEIADKNYQTKFAQIADAGFQLCNKGVLLESHKKDIGILDKMKQPTLHDEYVFIRKYWGIVWASFAFFIRIFTLKNPVKEIIAFAETRKIKQVNIYTSLMPQDKFNSFESALIASQPLVAIIIPTLNRYVYLKDVLEDLEKQDYKNFEVIVVDQSDNYDENFYKNFKLNIKNYYQKERKLWTARNFAIKSTPAEYLLFFDDDSRVASNWVSSHLKCIDFFKVDISAGVSLAAIGQKISKSYDYFRWSTQFDSGNALVKRNVFKKIGLFDELFNGMRMGDGEFSFRAYKHGLKSISNPVASRVHLKVSSGGLRDMGSWDGFRPKKWFAPKPVPSVIYLFNKYLSKEYRNNALLIGIMLSNIPYKQKRSSKMMMLSFVLTFLKSPVLLIQFARANAIANKMQKNDKGNILLIE